MGLLFVNQKHSWEQIQNRSDLIGYIGQTHWTAKN